MLAAQKLNHISDQTVYGITTNGQVWQFGQLHGGAFIQDLRTFTLEDIDNVGAALHFVFAQCREQVMRLYAAI